MTKTQSRSLTPGTRVVNRKGQEGTVVEAGMTGYFIVQFDHIDWIVQVGYRTIETV